MAVIFRTNADITIYGSFASICGTYNESVGTDGNNIWIAYDVNADGNLVGFGKTSGALTSFNCNNDPSSNPHGINAPGGCRFYKGDDENIGVCYGSSYPRRFNINDSDAANAILNTEPTEPYASNGQEVYDEEPQAEGFLNITGITYPPSAVEGEIVDFTVHTENTGMDDSFMIELTGDVTGSSEFLLGASLTYNMPFQFIMPNHSVSITVNAYHLE